MNQNYKYIISTILIFTVVIFTATAVRDDLKSLVVSLETPVQTQQTEEIKEDVQETKEVKEENIPVKTVDDYEQEEEQEYIEPEVTPKTVKQNTSNNYADYSPYLPEKPTQKSTPSTTTKTTQHATVQKSIEKPKTPANPYQKEIDDDNFPVTVYTPNKHIKFMVFYPSTLYKNLEVGRGYTLNIVFDTWEKGSREYWKLKHLVESIYNHNCFYSRTVEYKTAKPVNFFYCYPNSVLSEIESLAEILQNRGYNVYISDEDMDYLVTQSDKELIWKKYNGAGYEY